MYGVSDRRWGLSPLPNGKPRLGARDLVLGAACDIGKGTGGRQADSHNIRLLVSRTERPLDLIRPWTESPAMAAYAFNTNSRVRLIANAARVHLHLDGHSGRFSHSGFSSTPSRRSLSASRGSRLHATPGLSPVANVFSSTLPPLTSKLTLAFCLW